MGLHKERYQAAARRLARQHRWGLAFHVLAGLVVIGAGEALMAASGFAGHAGLVPTSLRVLGYLLVTTLVWYAILRWNRRLATRLFAESLGHYEAVLQAFDAALGLRDRYTHGHGLRVARYAEIIARELALPEAEVEAIREGALLHDIGKIAWPDAVLVKEGAPSESEWALIRDHPAAAAAILESNPALRPLAPAVRAHHERYDGRGYPDGLLGEAIPLAARVIAIADAFDALCSDRPYRPALSPEAAVAVLCEGSGTQFDPSIVRAAASLAELTAAPMEPVAQKDLTERASARTM